MRKQKQTKQTKQAGPFDGYRNADSLNRAAKDAKQTHFGRLSPRDRNRANLQQTSADTYEYRDPCPEDINKFAPEDSIDTEGAREALERAHRAKDPHCTCTDCMRYHQAQQAAAIETRVTYADPLTITGEERARIALHLRTAVTYYERLARISKKLGRPKAAARHTQAAADARELAARITK